ncbi:hypothetical protein FBEOM_4230 [Fusarium beomiforme]|uniref:F-box domain-containing protein n=1 Tax=Fusarium beomiforme TaxID=44412 RepID=A0A9P5DYF4_9HYPO|nr:hypothetical protein FBEOM_4230 [Fusarium beomiforme]
MELLSTEILSMIASEAAASVPEVDLNTIFDVWDIDNKLKYPSSLPRENSLAPFAVVSRKWQLAFEPFAFHTLILSPKRLAEAVEFGYLTQRRLGYVRIVAVPISFSLPRPWDDPIVFPCVGEWPTVAKKRSVKEDQDDALCDDEVEAVDEDINDEEDFPNVTDFPRLPDRGYDRIFARIIKILSRTLKVAPIHENEQPYIDIRFGFPVPREYGLPNPAYPVENREADPMEGFWTTPVDLPDLPIPLENRECDSMEDDWGTPVYLGLDLGDEELPELPVIASCSFELVSWSIFFLPDVACAIASKMPCLNKLKLHLSDREWRAVGFRKRLRRNLANSLSALPASICDFDFHYSRGVPRDHSHQPASIIDPEEECDLLSQELFKFSQRENMVRFSASGSFELNILGSSEERLGSSHGWSKLQHYDIGFLPITPSGRWLAIRYTDTPNTDRSRIKRWGPPCEAARGPASNFQTNEFRGTVDAGYAHDLLFAAGQAASQMPSLVNMNVKVGVIEGYKISYTSKKVKTEPCMRIDGWKLQPPTEELVSIWRRAAQRHKRDFMVLWADSGADGFAIWFSY